MYTKFTQWRAHTPSQQCERIGFYLFSAFSLSLSSVRSLWSLFRESSLCFGIQNHRKEQQQQKERNVKRIRSCISEMKRLTASVTILISFGCSVRSSADVDAKQRCKECPKNSSENVMCVFRHASIWLFERCQKRTINLYNRIFSSHLFCFSGCAGTSSTWTEHFGRSEF